MLSRCTTRRPRRQSRHGLYGRRRERRLGGQLLFELEPVLDCPLDAGGGSIVRMVFDPQTLSQLAGGGSVTKHSEENIGTG